MLAVDYVAYLLTGKIKTCLSLINKVAFIVISLACEIETLIDTSLLAFVLLVVVNL